MARNFLKKDMKETLRYKHMVARLQGLPAYKLEAELLKEIAKGRNWRMNAVMDAIDAEAEKWWKMDSMRMFDHIGMFGRLSAMERLSATFKYKLKDESSVCPRQISAAFDQAVIHGHYRVANFCKTRGASPNYMIDSNRAPRAVSIALDEKNYKKITYLFKSSLPADSDFSAVVASGDRKMIDFFLDHGADVNKDNGSIWTPFKTAVQHQDNDLARYLISKGADLAKNHASSQSALNDAVDQGNMEMVALILSHGIKAHPNTVASALMYGRFDAAEMILKSGFSIQGERDDQEPLLAALRSPEHKDEAIAFCLKHGADVAAAIRVVEAEPSYLTPEAEKRRQIDSLKKYLKPVSDAQHQDGPKL